MNPYAFFVGCPRSGTTLLGRIGNAHPELAVIHETQWIARTFERRRGLTPEGVVTPELLARLCEHPRFMKLGLPIGALEQLAGEDEPVPYADFVTAIFDRYGAARSKRFVGDKTPRYVRSIPTLSGLWPEARFVHLVRDGRDVCLSVLDWRKGATNFSTWAEDPVSTVALWWEWQVRLGLEARAELGPDRYHELRYESLVDRPEAECAALCEFLELPYDGAMLRFHEGRTREGPDAKKAWRPVTRGIRSWRDDMSAEDVERFDAVAGPLLEELGYERPARPAGAATRERAERLRSRFAEEVLARRRAVPAAWERAAA